MTDQGLLLLGAALTYPWPLLVLCSAPQVTISKARKQSLNVVRQSKNVTSWHIHSSSATGLSLSLLQTPRSASWEFLCWSISQFNLGLLQGKCTSSRPAGSQGFCTERQPSSASCWAIGLQQWMPASCFRWLWTLCLCWPVCTGSAH